MQVDLRDAARRRIGRIEIDADQRPALVRVARGDETLQEVFLNWDQALDDAGCLRHCVACGGSLYRTRTMPQVTPFVVVLAASGAVIAALGLAVDPWVYGSLVAVLILDVLVLVLARSRLVCYRCGSSFDRVPVARYHRRWDSREAESATPPDHPSTSASG